MSSIVIPRAAPESLSGLYVGPLHSIQKKGVPAEAQKIS